MHNRDLPQSDMKWLEPWRTVSECTTGNLGLPAAFGVLMEELRHTRESSLMRVYGDVGRRGTRLLENGMSPTADSGPSSGVVADRVCADSQTRSVSRDAMRTPLLFALDTTSEMTSVGSTCENYNGDELSVPRISGFSAFVRRWDEHAAPVVSSGGSRICHERERRHNSGEEYDDDDDEGGRGRLPVTDFTARPTHSPDHLHDDASLLGIRYLTSDEAFPETTNGDDFGEEGHLACVPGNVLNNRFALIRQLGCGRSGCVWLAADLDQCTVARRQLMRKMDEHHLRTYFSSEERPLFVAIKVFRCGTTYGERAEHEALMLAYIKEWKKIEWLQRQVSLPSSVNDLHDSALRSSSTGHGGGRVNSPAAFSVCSRSFASDSPAPSEEMSRSSSIYRLASMRDRFIHQGKFGVHNCIVMDIMGTSLETLMNEMKLYGGVPVTVARGIICSILEDLVVLEVLHIVHNDICPENILFFWCEEDIESGTESFLVQSFENPTMAASNVRSSHLQESKTSQSRSGAGVRSVVSPRPPANGIVDTPHTGRHRHQNSCRTSCQLFKGSNAWGARVESPYALQLTDFDHSMIVPQHLRKKCLMENHPHGETTNHGKFKEMTPSANKMVHNSNTKSRTPSGRVTPASVETSSPSNVRDVTPGFAVCTHFTDSLAISPSSLCPTNLVSDLERHILSRQNYKSGLLGQARKYRAPEAILGKEYDTALDIWSLGCIAFELVLGHLAFDPFHDFSVAMGRNEQLASELRDTDSESTGHSDDILYELKEGAQSSSVNHASNFDTQNSLFHSLPFNDDGKRIDVYHLRSVMFLLGPPAPRYILSTPMGENVRDFFDAHGRFIFLSKDEHMQMYCDDNSAATPHCSHCYYHHSGTSESCASGTTHNVSSEDVVVNGSNSQRHDSADSCRCCTVTPAWLKLREEIRRRLGKEEGAAFENFLKKCLQWDPEERQTAQALLRSQWITAEEDATFDVSLC